MATTLHDVHATDASRATLYRMVTDEHICPFGLKAKDLLEREGFEVDDHLLGSRDETDAFKERHGVETTPQVFLEGRRIGGYEALREHLGKDEADADDDDTTYQPVVATFGTTALLAAALSYATLGTPLSLRALEWFVALSMGVLAVFKLRDLESFSNQFLGYDLLAQRVVRYAYVYPFVEAFAAVGMLTADRRIVPVAAIAGLCVGLIGAVSVIKAVYVDGRDVRCACVGGDSNVPLGAISLSENLAMIAMGIWMPLKLFVL